MNKKQFEEKFKECKKEAKVVNVRLKNYDVAYANKFKPMELVPDGVWLLRNGQFILFTKYRHIKDMWSDL